MNNTHSHFGEILTTILQQRVLCSNTIQSTRPSMSFFVYTILETSIIVKKKRLDSFVPRMYVSDAEPRHFKVSTILLAPHPFKFRSSTPLLSKHTVSGHFSAKSEINICSPSKISTRNASSSYSSV